MKQPEETFKLQVMITIEKFIGDSYSGERMGVNQQVQLRSVNFLQMCQILGKFQELAEEIRQGAQ